MRAETIPLAGAAHEVLRRRCERSDAGKPALDRGQFEGTPFHGTFIQLESADKILTETDCPCN